MRIWNIVFLALGLVGLGWLIHRVGLEDILVQLARLGWGFSLMVALQAASLFLDAATLRLCAGDDGRATPYAAFARATFTGHAINTLTPLGQLGEVTKWSQLAATLPPERVAGALLLQNLLLFASAAALVAVGPPLALLVLGVHGSFATLVMVTSSAFLIATIVTVVLTYRGPGERSFRFLRRLAGSVDGRAARAVAWLQRVEGLSRDAARHPGRMAAAWLLTLVSRVTGTAEIAVILSFLGHPQSILIALLTQASGQVVSWATSFVPLQAGTAEAGSYLLFRAVGLPPDVGVTMELARKARRLVFAAIGVGLLGADTFRRIVRQQRRPG